LAAAEGHETVVNELCKWCDISQIQAATYATNTTALMSAARFGHEALVGTLLDAKADPTRRLVDGRTVLFLASAAGYEGIVTQLIDALRSQGQLEAHVDVQREDGTSALIEASMYGHHETVQLLLDAEADVRDTAAHTPSTHSRADA
jgi:cytohesin